MQIYNETTMTFLALYTLHKKYNVKVNIISDTVKIILN